ncbi:mitochondrial import inner membrane translocase subunit Tim21 [Perognathus longimembris pacificus]|uniref:mitochondrial import inner membrane translocase subunit Tim21 n=1 Tax=Perognathus longimembris pacificus TaxID=214514 RepID=UPI002018E8D5|nr:mitochondrial import inner membrane translocase subunit Tim21 [Perognathus longimembris pacificus]
MIRALLRAAEKAESGRRLLLGACRRTAPGARSGPPEPVPTAARRSFWSPAPRPREAKGDGSGSSSSSKQVPALSSERPGAALSPAQKVKEAGRDFTYLIVVLIGISITGSLLYAIFKELFSSSSPNKIYGKALEKCRIHPEVVSIFGAPLKGYGEMSRRGRRQHVSFIEYVKDGLKHMRLKFYIEGSEPGKQGTVHVEVKENPKSGRYEFRYIFVETESFPRRTIVIEDNRSQDS